MKSLLSALLATISTISLQAQSWELHIASGLSYGRLLPSKTASHAGGAIHYGAGTPGIYLSPELDFKVNEHSRFSLGYQLSGNNTGIQIGSRRRTGAHEYSSDFITLHNISVGYSYRTLVFHNKMQIGGFGKLGMAYGQMTGISEGGSSGMLDNGAIYLSTSRITGFEVIPDFWTPVSTVGFIAGPVAKGRRIADRLTMTVSATMIWKDPYLAPSQTNYTFITGSEAHAGVARFSGHPLQMQVGVDYNLFRFGKK